MKFLRKMRVKFERIVKCCEYFREVLREVSENYGEISYLQKFKIY